MNNNNEIELQIQRGQDQNNVQILERANKYKTEDL